MASDLPGHALFATAARGTEGALRDELREIRVRGVRADRGGVHFRGSLDDAARVCLHSRIAMRVLVELGAFEAPSPQALYDGVRGLDFSPYLTPEHTLAVRATCNASTMTHTQFIAQKTKDAIVDTQRDRFGSRSSVQRDTPDVRIHVHLVRDRATIYVDAAGESLHRRGYRTHVTAAPIKETLAAALLRLGGWDRERPLCDPMCGGGTIAIEADLWARRVAPGLERSFGLERWACHDDDARRRMTELRESARAGELARGPDVFGFDADPAAVEVAMHNAARVRTRVHLGQRSVDELEPFDPPGMIACNPPYGERLDADRAFYREMARALDRLRGHRVAVLAGSPDIVRALPRVPRAQTLWNGDIECRLVAYDVE